MTAIDERIAETREQIMAACEEAGLGPVTEPDNVYDQDIHFGGARVHVHNAAYEWQNPQYEVEVRSVYDASYNVLLRAVVYKEPFNIKAITARIAKAQNARRVADLQDARASANKADEHARGEANTAALVAVPHAGLSATADAAGIHLHDLTGEQFAAAVAAIQGSE